MALLCELGDQNGWEATKTPHDTVEKDNKLQAKLNRLKPLRNTKLSVFKFGQKYPRVGTESVF